MARELCGVLVSTHVSVGRVDAALWPRGLHTARCQKDKWANRGLGLGVGTLGLEGSGVTFSNLRHDSPKPQHLCRHKCGDHIRSRATRAKTCKDAVVGCVS